MTGSYLQLPIKAYELINKKEHDRCSLSQSVASMLHLIITTHWGESKYNEDFGCEIWEHDFENIDNAQVYREKMKASIKKTIEKHEPRLKISRVDVQIEQIELMAQNQRTKSRISLLINGVLNKTNETFNYTEQFFIGPLSYTL